MREDRVEWREETRTRFEINVGGVIRKSHQSGWTEIDQSIRTWRKKVLTSVQKTASGGS